MSGCPVVQAWLDFGQFSLAELEKHMESCEVCQRILADVMKVMRDSLEGGDVSP